MSEFDYSAIWQRSGLTISDPWVRAKDLAGLFPQASLVSLRKRFTHCRSMMGKRGRNPIHVAEVAHALDMPLALVVDSVKQARHK